MEDEWRNRLVPVKLIGQTNTFQVVKGLGLVDSAVIADFFGGGTPKALTSDFAESEQS